MKIWVLADDRAGNVSQILGIAEALNKPFDIKKIRYTAFGQLPNMLRGSTLIGVDKSESDELEGPWPDVVLSAGRKTAPIARFIKQQSDDKAKLVHLMWPGVAANDFDLVVVPEHDQREESDMLMHSYGAPNRITTVKLEEEQKKWQDKFGGFPSPRVGLLVGGDTKKGKFTTGHATDLAAKMTTLLSTKHGSVLATTSRRTSQEAAIKLQKGIRGDKYFYDYTSGDENPYFGIMALADVLVVSGDSISMCSEACSTGKPVYIYAPSDLMPAKHQAFHQQLYEKGLARPLTGVLEMWDYDPLQEAKRIATKVLALSK